jgi:hypothetical protein
MSATMANYYRRRDEWKHQAQLVDIEKKQIDAQISAANTRYNIAQSDLDNHDAQIANTQQIEEFLRDKYTNEDLYNWMVSEVTGLYFQTYQLAYDLAKRAERAYRFEPGLTDSNFIQFGYWDSLKQGLLAGERLHLALKQLERAYLDQNKREYEITRQISLLQFDPLALIALKETGQCVFSLPEAFFDMDYPGHYMRRLKSVSLTIPAVTGPYTSINCTLTLLSSKIRKDSTLSPDYPEGEDDPRFIYSFAAVQSIATSHGQNDSGMFELNFRDERYLPFEGAGTVSTWRLDMPQECNTFDFETITDVIIRLNYTAREGGDILRRKAFAAAELPARPRQMPGQSLALPAQEHLLRMFSAKHEFANDWYRFTHSTAAAPALPIDLSQERFPFQFRRRNLTATGASLFMKLKSQPQPNSLLTGFSLDTGNTTYTVDLGPQSSSAGDLLVGHISFDPNPEDIGGSTKWTLSVVQPTGPQLTQLDDLWIVFDYNA